MRVEPIIDRFRTIFEASWNAGFVTNDMLQRYEATVALALRGRLRWILAHAAEDAGLIAVADVGLQISGLPNTDLGLYRSQAWERPSGIAEIVTFDRLHAGASLGERLVQAVTAGYSEVLVAVALPRMMVSVPSSSEWRRWTTKNADEKEQKIKSLAEAWREAALILRRAVGDGAAVIRLMENGRNQVL